MTFWQYVLLVAAGFFGGVANAIAGGASLFTFPAMLATGLPPIVANASNALALLPSNSLAAYLDREKLPPRTTVFFAGMSLAVIGGIIGAGLLLLTPARVFVLVVPALIGIATLIFIFSKAVQRSLKAVFEGDEHPRLRGLLIFVSCIYGGYFGAGLGVVLLAVLSATTHWELRSNNAFKNVLGFTANLAANAIFVWQGVISWPQTLVMLVGTAVGGYAGVGLIKILPAFPVRNVIGVAGCFMTAIYVYRYWL